MKDLKTKRNRGAAEAGKWGSWRTWERHLKARLMHQPGRRRTDRAVPSKILEDVAFRVLGEGERRCGYRSG